jgi:hypothetical protein
MRSNSHARSHPHEKAVRDYAYHLYEQGGRKDGHDFDHWIEATACIEANIPTSRSNVRLHWFANDPESGIDNLLAAEALGSAPEVHGREK